MTADTITAIKTALEGVTPGPWLVRPHWSSWDKFEIYPDREVDLGSPAEIMEVSGHRGDYEDCAKEAKANADYIAALNPVIVTELLSTLESLQRENEELRLIVSKSAESLGTGAFVSPTCTVEFMSGVPNEISSTVSMLRIQASKYATDAETVRRERDAADARESKLRVALTKLVREAGVVSNFGAVPGRRWTLLAGALINARAALASTGGEHHAE